MHRRYEEKGVDCHILFCILQILLQNKKIQPSIDEKVPCLMTSFWSNAAYRNQTYLYKWNKSVLLRQHSQLVKLSRNYIFKYRENPTTLFHRHHSHSLIKEVLEIRQIKGIFLFGKTPAMLYKYIKMKNLYLLRCIFRLSVSLLFCFPLPLPNFQRRNAVT